MTVGYLTQSDLVSLKIWADKILLDTVKIQDLITSHLSSIKRKAMADGINYYNCEHDILRNKRYYYIDGRAVENQTRANFKIPHPFHKILVDQKVSYIAGNPIVVSVSENDNATIAEEHQSSMIEYLDDSFDDKVNDWIIGACNKGVEWLHFYIDPDGELQLIVVPAEQIIPVYDTQYQNDLIYVIRYYEYELIGSDGRSLTRYKVEWWDKEKVEYWVQLENNSYVLDTSYLINPCPHWFSFNTTEPGTKFANSWGRVPFIPLYNNSEMQTDIHTVKPLIDSYDKVKCGWANDVEDFKELIYVLKGYEARRPVNAQGKELYDGITDLGLFMKNLVEQGVVTVTEDGNVTTLKAEIPVDAKEKLLALTRQEIFYFGEGVDVTSKDMGSDPSGVKLKFLYASLDLKANRLIRKLKTALKGVAWFVTTFINIVENKQYDPEQVIFTINKSMIFNEKEKIDEIKSMQGELSTRTRLENNPLVDDVEEELNRLDEEKQSTQAEDEKKFNQQLQLAQVNKNTLPLENK
jgi:SPP1 family phage portal protein